MNKGVVLLFVVAFPAHGLNLTETTYHKWNLVCPVNSSFQFKLPLRLVTECSVICATHDKCYRFVWDQDMKVCYFHSDVSGLHSTMVSNNPNRAMFAVTKRCK